LLEPLFDWKGVESVESRSVATTGSLGFGLQIRCYVPHAFSAKLI